MSQSNKLEKMKGLAVWLILSSFSEIRKNYKFKEEGRAAVVFNREP